MNESKAQHADYRLIAIAAALLVCISFLAFYREATPDWREHQEKVRAWVSDHLGEDRAAAVPMGMQQVYIEKLDRVDRCVTCHTTIEWGEELAEAPHPARSHPPLPIFEHHPIESFGCTLCHGGQGSATEMDAAHGRVAFWEEPLLDTQLAQKHGLSRAELMEVRCNTCHRADYEVAGMPLLNEAKAVVHKKRCNRCHVINGEGASKAPDLTREGDKHPSHYHFPKDWNGAETAFDWHVAHFREPFAIVPDTMMPSYTWKDRQVEALSLLVLSWRSLDLPAAWVPTPRTKPPPLPKRGSKRRKR